MKAFIEKFERGTQYVKVVAPVTKKELTDSNFICDDYLKKHCIKFIPASGAATRMFKNLYAFLEDNIVTDFVADFFKHLNEFAFYDDVKEFIDQQELDLETLEGKLSVVDFVLNGPLKYGSKPKALIKMHTYKNSVTTPIDEHIFEGKAYAGKDHVDLHFTISEAHENMFKAYVKNATEDMPEVKITYSFQKPSTDTLAVDMNNQPFLLEDGKAFYRAGGHGALIENLNDLECDIVYIKNIDNVCHQSRVDATIKSKKKLASIGLEIKEKVDLYLNQLQDSDYDLNEIGQFIKDKLNIRVKKELTKTLAIQLLNRPLRVCGMVKNQGEPGGGPFIVDNGDYEDLQICETAEIDLNNPKSKSILSQSAYFNPVDLVCFLKDYQNNKFDLREYVNKDRYFISEKSYKGRPLKALEHPGLWNGAMHNWISIFVEVPLETFNPVKTVNDLLRPGHQPK